MNQTNDAATVGSQHPQIAMIGCGAIAELLYLPAFAKHREFIENMILVDRDTARARMMAEKFGVKNCVGDFRDALHLGVKGAVIALPTHLHYSIARECLAANVHVLCEKPLTETAHEARQLIEQAEASRMALAVNYMRRLLPTYKRVKELLNSRALGAPLMIKYHEGEEFRWPTVTGFRFDGRLSSKGVLLDKGSHILDLICWWLNGKPEITSSNNDSFGGPEAVAEVHFRHEACTGEMKFSVLGKFPSRFMVRCENGSIEGDAYDFRSLDLVSSSGKRKRVKLHAQEKGYFDFGDAIVTNFIDVVYRGSQPLFSGKDVLDSMDCLDACYAAATRFEMPWYEQGAAHHGS